YGARMLYANPVVPSAPVSICAGETPTLTAAAAPGTTLRWYGTASSTDILGTGNSFTPSAPLTAGTTYYIAVVKDGETCENPDRIPVPVTVNPSATANDITIGDASVCIGDGVT